MIALILIASASLCQAQEAKVVRQFADGSYEVEIGAQRLQAFTNKQLNDQAKAFDKLQARADASQKDRAEADGQIATLKHELALRDKDVEIANLNAASWKKDLDRSQADFARAQDDAKRNFGLYLGQHQLVIQAQEQFIPRGNSHGTLAKIADFLNTPAVQATFKVAIPLFQTARSFSACH